MIDNNVRYSFIIPIYNTGDTIVTSLRTVIGGCGDDGEIILIDDGSEDNSSRLAEGVLQSYNFNNYKIIRQSNKGVSAARNKGIEAARGEYLLFCDSDDQIEGNLTETISGVNSKQDLIVWRFHVEQDDKLTTSDLRSLQNITGKITANELLKAFLIDGFKIRIGSFAIKKAFLLENHILFTEGVNYGEDIEFILKVLARAQLADVLDGYFYRYIKHSGSMIYSRNNKRLEAPYAIARASDYINKTSDGIDEDNRNYIQNELYVTHAIYALDGCIRYCRSIKEVFELYHTVNSEYIELHKNLIQKVRNTGCNPIRISKKKIRVLKISLWLYMLIVYIAKAY